MDPSCYPPPHGPPSGRRPRHPSRDVRSNPCRPSRISLMPKKISRPPASEPSDSKKRTTVTLPASLHKATKQRALDDDCDFSDVVAAALRAYLA